MLVLSFSCLPWLLIPHQRKTPKSSGFVFHLSPQPPWTTFSPHCEYSPLDLPFLSPFPSLLPVTSHSPGRPRLPQAA